MKYNVHIMTYCLKIPHQDLTIKNTTVNFHRLSPSYNCFSCYRSCIECHVPRNYAVFSWKNRKINGQGHEQILFTFVHTQQL